MNCIFWLNKMRKYYNEIFFHYKHGDSEKWPRYVYFMCKKHTQLMSTSDDFATSKQCNIKWLLECDVRLSLWGHLPEIP